MSDSNRGEKIFQMLHDQFNNTLKEMGVRSYDPVKMELFVLHEAHSMMRSGKISKEEFAVCMDEAVCW